MAKNIEKKTETPDEENLQLSTIPVDPKFAIKELEKGHLIAVRSGNEFMYIIEQAGQYRMFTHTVGAKEAGKRVVDKAEQFSAMIRSIVKIADAAYAAEFPSSMNLYAVMQAMESAIMQRYPEVEKAAESK